MQESVDQQKAAINNLQATFEERLGQQKAAINNLQATFEERLDHLENKLASYMQSFQEICEAQSIKHDTWSACIEDFKSVPFII